MENFFKLSDQALDKIANRLERDEAELAEGDYDRYIEIIKQGRGKRWRLALWPTLRRSLVTLGIILFFLSLPLILEGRLSSLKAFGRVFWQSIMTSPNTVLVLLFGLAYVWWDSWKSVMAPLRLQENVAAMDQVHQEIEMRQAMYTQLTSLLYEYGFQRLLAEEAEKYL